MAALSLQFDLASSRFLASPPDVTIQELQQLRGVKRHADPDPSPYFGTVSKPDSGRFDHISLQGKLHLSQSKHHSPKKRDADPAFGTVFVPSDHPRLEHPSSIVKPHHMSIKLRHPKKRFADEPASQNFLDSVRNGSEGDWDHQHQRVRLKNHPASSETDFDSSTKAPSTMSPEFKLKPHETQHLLYPLEDWPVSSVRRISSLVSLS